jgi:hypothetical protein
MTRNQSVALRCSRFQIPVALVAAGFVAALFVFPGSSCLAQQGPGLSAHPGAPSTYGTQVLPDRTIVHFHGDQEAGVPLGASVYLPADARRVDLAFSRPGTAASAPGGLKTLRGLKVLQVVLEPAEPGPLTIEIRHDGDWSAMNTGRQARLHSSSLHPAAALPMLPPDKSGGFHHGTYLIVHGPAFANAIAPLVDWKTRKGFEVVTVSTGQTGSTQQGIKAYIQEAYDTWDYPPEYVLLVGDVDVIPAYSFYGNPSDLPYVLLDGDDWLPDAMVGRLSVENDTEARTVINRTVSYEREPHQAGEDDWFTRSVMVAGVVGSDTPVHTIRYCGEQLEKIGFTPAQAFTHPPLPTNADITPMFNPAMDNGASVVAYRGWAYGSNGWDDPQYTVDGIGGMDNVGKWPVVMSFVCLTGDYTASSPCFGEVFLRHGLPDQPKGAVAFIGNGEHWSHTRYNDAMAISFFERIIDSQITDLGSLMTAAKLRFYDYFPHEVDAETFGEESVEFYFHIYNLMGDPDLHFWKSTPVALDVTHAANVPAGTDFLEVSVTAAGPGTPLPGATVTAVAGGALLGSALTDENGIAWLDFPPVTDGSALDITVTGPGLVSYEGTTVAGLAASHLAVTDLALDDGQSAGSGNADQAANPGEELALTLTMTNTGSGSSGDFSVSLVEVRGPAATGSETVDMAGLAAGGSGETPTPLTVSVNDDAHDGDVITLIVEAQEDRSLIELTVASPGLRPLALAPLDGSTVTPGGSFDLALALQADGSIGTSGGSVTLSVLGNDGAELTSDTATFGACESGAQVLTTEELTLSVDGNLATGTNLDFLATITTTEGWVTETTCSLVLGPVDPGTVCGPDSYGYFAYDSADLDYPSSRPEYRWSDISPTFGGSGTELSFPVDNEIVNVQVDLPFTFTYYGQDYTRIRVSDNGWIAFDLSPDFNFYNWTIPSEHGNNALVAPYWDNLVPSGDGGDNGLPPDGIFYHHDPAAGAFTVQWSRLHRYDPPFDDPILGYQTFQAVLLDPAMHPTTSGDGEILFYYRDVNNNDHLRNYASVGLEDHEGRTGLQLSYAGINDPGLAALQPGMAIRLTTEPPVRVPFTLSRFTARQEGSRTRLEWECSDDRPVTGWHIDRLDGAGVTRLTETPVPGSARSWETGQIAADEGASGVEVRFRLTALHPYGTSSQPGETVSESGTILGLALHRASPNPSTGSTAIAFALPADGDVRLRVYDAAGRLVRTLIDGRAPAGEGLRTWDGRDDRGAPAAGGVYFFRLDSGGKTLTRKMILVR